MEYNIAIKLNSLKPYELNRNLDGFLFDKSDETFIGKCHISSVSQDKNYIFILYRLDDGWYSREVSLTDFDNKFVFVQITKEKDYEISKYDAVKRINNGETIRYYVYHNKSMDITQDIQYARNIGFKVDDFDYNENAKDKELPGIRFAGYGWYGYIDGMLLNEVSKKIIMEIINNNIPVKYEKLG